MVVLNTMSTPTHIQVTVHRARNLKAKGKGGLNDSYATIQLGKEKYQTTIKERTIEPEWQEECDLPISDQTQNVKLGVFHRNLLGLDEFLGEVCIPLQELHIFARPTSRWYRLKGKAGSKKSEKDRGELEVTTTFIIQNASSSQLSLNVGSKTKKSLSFRNLAHTVGDKLNVKFSSRGSLNKYGSKADLDSSGVFSSQDASQKSLTGEISGEISGASSDKSLPQSEEPVTDAGVSSLSSSIHELSDCRHASVVSDRSARPAHYATLGSVRTSRGAKSTTVSEDWPDEGPRSAREAAKCHTLSYATGHTKMAMYELHEIDEYKRARQKLDLSDNDSDVVAQLSSYEREDLLRLVVEQRSHLAAKDAYIHDLEDYIDNLLVKVIETQPKLLQNPYVRSNGNSYSVGINNRTTTSVPSGLSTMATLSPGVYLTNSRNREITTAFTGIVTQGVKTSKSSQRSANGNPLKFFQSLINTK